MPDEIAQKFMDALHVLEESQSVEPLVALYTDTAEIGNVLRSDKFQGQEGARQFWTEYRGTFDRVQSTFRNVLSADGRAALEWVTSGTSFDGKPVHYEGVTILEAANGRVSRSCAYFNPSALGEQIV